MHVINSEVADYCKICLLVRLLTYCRAQRGVVYGDCGDSDSVAWSHINDGPF